MIDWPLTPKTPNQISLGALIDSLRNLPSDEPVLFDLDAPASPGRFASYRGYYEDLAVSLWADGGDIATTVGEFLTRAEAAVGDTFEGYKGGSYVARRETPVWASDWGEASGRAVIGLFHEGGRVIILTEIEE